MTNVGLGLGWVRGRRQPGVALNTFGLGFSSFGMRSAIFGQMSDGVVHSSVGVGQICFGFDRFPPAFRWLRPTLVGDPVSSTFRKLASSVNMFVGRFVRSGPFLV